MSLEALRQNALTRTRHEIGLLQRSHCDRLRGLRAVTNCIAANASLATLCTTDFPAEHASVAPEDELLWLSNNTLQHSNHFDDTALPPPPAFHHAPAIHASTPNRHPSQPPEPVQADAGTDERAGEASVAPQADLTDLMAVAAVQKPATALRDTQAALEVPADEALPPGSGTVVLPDQVAPPEPEEEAQLAGATESLLDSETPQRPAKTLHLPPEDVQEERLREREAAMRQKSADPDSSKGTRFAPAAVQTHTEPASSPSSTNGAHSTATPLPVQESPDTSPDSEHPPDVIPPKDLRPSPEEQRAKEEHDRLLEAQKEIARKAALGDINDTPDDQLRWEEREAAARDAEEQAARESVNGPEPDARNVQEETQAEEVAAEVENDEVPSQPGQADVVPDAVQDGSTGEAILTAEAPLPYREDVTGPLALTDTSQQSGEPNGAHKRTFSEMTGDEPRTSPVMIRRQHSMDEPLSPTTIKQPDDAPVPGSATLPLHTLRPPPSTPTHRRIPSDPYAALDNVDALKGAAEDPERDYLEPLFKIQAYDSGNVRASALPELIRSASKTLFTEDHFASQHERLEYRMLRRIYQLQNANKWSLRQMDKVKEPPQPLSHMDHMMAEMKWMRKDFRTERRMKRSVCALLAQSCADWVAADLEERKAMQVRVNPPTTDDQVSSEEPVPDLDSGESAPEDDFAPSTPVYSDSFPASIVVAPELSETVIRLKETGKLGHVLKGLPVASPWGLDAPLPSQQMLAVSKLVDAKILPLPVKPPRKRSRYDYEDDADLLDNDSDRKRFCPERDLSPEDQEIALFHPDNKQIRDRLHANSIFRPPSEFQMPSTSFYEFRQGSHWILEDDQKLRRLAKEHAFNWSLISEEMTLPSRFKSSFERRTPWECFERWVELDTLPVEMRKTAYFKTWFQRLEQSAQASERRFQTQVAAMQQAQSAAHNQIPVRRKTTPARVEKRKNNRYLWLVDAMRKLARRREQEAYKRAEQHRTATSRKSVAEANQPKPPSLTPQQFSQKRYERDLQQQEALRQRRQALMEAQQHRQAQMVRAAAAQQQGMPNGMQGQSRPGVNGIPQQHPQMQVNGQQHPNMNGQAPPSRQPLPMATRNGHLAVPQVGAQGIPQAQMRPGGAVQHPNMQRMAQASVQTQNGQYNAQQYQMANGSMASPGNGGMTTQQQLQSNQALLNQYNSQQQANSGTQVQGMQNTNGHQMAGSPSMPPPPTPGQAPQQLSSGHVPAVIAIKNQLRLLNPHWTEEQLQSATNQRLHSQSQSQSTSQARQSAMNAAAGINGIPAQNGNNTQAYLQNQAAYQANGNVPGGTASYTNGDAGSGGSPPQQAPMSAGASQTSPQASYAQVMRQRQLQQMRNMSSPVGMQPQLASPNMQPASPSLQYANMGGVGVNVNVNAQQQQSGQQRPPSRSNTGTPQMQRLGSSGSVPGVAAQTGGMQSPGPGALQGSPRGMQAGMAR